MRTLTATLATMLLALPLLAQTEITTTIDPTRATNVLRIAIPAPEVTGATFEAINEPLFKPLPLKEILFVVVKADHGPERNQVPLPQSTIFDGYSPSSGRFSPGRSSQVITLG